MKPFLTALLFVSVFFNSCQSPFLIPCNSSEYSSELLTYFMEVALNYPSTDSSRIVKWQTDIHIAVHGSPSADDIANVRQLTDELNLLIKPIKIYLDKTEPNIHLFFSSPQTFQAAEAHFKEVNNPILNGVTYVYPDSNYQIYKANILISNRIKDPLKRAHTIREEVTQSLGLLTDSWQHQQSIFYEGQSYITSFSAMDEQLILLLYNTDTQTGWQAKDVLKYVCGHTN